LNPEPGEPGHHPPPIVANNPKVSKVCYRCQGHSSWLMCCASSLVFFMHLKLNSMCLSYLWLFVYVSINCITCCIMQTTTKTFALSLQLQQLQKQTNQQQQLLVHHCHQNKTTNDNNIDCCFICVTATIIKKHTHTCSHHTHTHTHTRAYINKPTYASNLQSSKVMQLLITKHIKYYY